MELTGTGWALLKKELKLQHWDTVGCAPGMAFDCVL